MLYRVIEDITSHGLGEIVESLAKRGWKLQGGISVVDRGGRIFFYQAMTLETENG